MNKNITDTDRLKFMAEYMKNISLGYPIVFFVGEEREAQWGYNSVHTQKFSSINDLRDTIDKCIDGYNRHLEYEKNKSFD